MEIEEIREEKNNRGGNRVRLGAWLKQYMTRIVRDVAFTECMSLGSFSFNTSMSPCQSPSSRAFLSISIFSLPLFRRLFLGFSLSIFHPVFSHCICLFLSQSHLAFSRPLNFFIYLHRLLLDFSLFSFSLSLSPYVFLSLPQFAHLRFFFLLWLY